MPLRRRLCLDDRGFSLLEVLVVVLIIGILAAIAVPAFLNQKSKASDAAAKAQVRTAETAAETYSTDHNGSYTNMTLASLQEIEPALKDTATAKLSVGTVTSTSYQVTSESVTTKNKYTIYRTSSNGVERKCEPASSTEKGGCPNGEVGSPGSW